MTRVLDPRFGAIVAYMEGAGSYIERAAARENAEAVALAAGYSFNEALAELRGKPTPSISDPLLSFVVIEPEPAAPDDPSLDPSYPSKTRDERIAEALARDPSRSDRDVARLVGCSPTTVGRARAAAGLASTVRVVNRRGRSYEMRVATAPAAGDMS